MRFDPKEITVTVLSGDPQHASLDKGVLTRMKFQEVKAFPSLEQSLAHMRASSSHIALIDSRLKDMDGLEALRSLVRNREIPVRALVMVTDQCQKEYVMDAVSAGCSGYVIRPYSLETLERHIRAAWQSLAAGEIEQEMVKTAKDSLFRGDFDAAISEFEEVLTQENEALKYFNMGMEYLRAQSFGRAIIAFNKAVALNELYAEAYRGLAYAHKGKGDASAYQDMLRKSADLFALQDKLGELKEVFAEILKADPEAVNPYNTLGVKLRRSGDYLGALHAYNQALEVTPYDENLHYNIAKAHSFAGNDIKALEHLHSALSIRGDFPEARAMAAKLSGGIAQAMDAGQSEHTSGSNLLID